MTALKAGDGATATTGRGAPLLLYHSTRIPHAPCHQSTGARHRVRTAVAAFLPARVRMVRRSRPGHSGLRSLGSADPAPSSRLPPGAGVTMAANRSPKEERPMTTAGDPNADLLRQVQGKNRSPPT